MHPERVQRGVHHRGGGFLVVEDGEGAGADYGEEDGEGFEPAGGWRGKFGEGAVGAAF